MVLGLIGMLFLALPGLAGHSHAASLVRGGGHPLAGHVHTGGSHPLAAGSARGAPAHAAAQSAVQAAPGPHDQITALPVPVPSSNLRFLPNPRAVFSVMALYGASGYALAGTFHLLGWVAALVALVPAVLLERLAVTPLWNVLFRFQGVPDSPIQELILSECVAVTPFRNGRGVVQVVRDGRMVQFSAHLTSGQSHFAVGVGEQLRIEDVDAARERVTVSIT